MATTPMIAYNKKLVKTLQGFKDKRILILGFGREGRDTFRFLQAQLTGAIFGIADKSLDIKFPAKKIKNINQKSKNNKTAFHLGKNYLKAIKNYDIIIKSPGVPPKVIAPYINRGQKITSQTEVFFNNCPGTIIGVTGTKGKSTTSAMIYKILNENRMINHTINHTIHLVGNIGKPALSSLLRAKPDD